MNSLFTALEISGSAMSAERQRAEVVTANMANAETTHTSQGGPYRRKEVVFSSTQTSPFQLMFANLREGRHSSPGVNVQSVVEDSTPPIMRYEPGHPDADKDGYVAYPAIDPIEEMVDLMGASRAYALNASAITASKQMIQQSLDLLK